MLLGNQRRETTFPKEILPRARVVESKGNRLSARPRSNAVLGPKRRSRGRTLAIGLLLAVGASEINSQPLPPRRPPEPGSAKLAGPDEGSDVGAPDMGACLVQLADMGVRFQTETAPSNDDACIVAMPVRLERLLVRDGAGGSIQFAERPLIDCRLAKSFVLWVGGVVAPVLAENFSSGLKTVKTGSGFECRNRNREAAGKLSAHALGLALDISGFELANGRVLSFGSSGDPAAQAALQTIRTAACGWFTTVLGPGSDAAHENHLHLDIQQHGADGRYRICE